MTTKSNAQGSGSEERSVQSEPAKKRGYVSPTLRELGTVPELTHGSAMTVSEGLTKRAGP